MKVSHEWLKEYVGDALPATDKVAELLTAHAFEIDDVEQTEYGDVLDVDVLPNRSSDCLCQRGIARELATILHTELAYDPLREAVDLETTDAIEVTIADETACPRFTAALIKDIEVKESPEWLQKRLRALGQRPINNIVDATNYVMYAIGQPLHAYDADLFPQVDGKWQFEVRFAKEGEQVSLIPEGGKNKVIAEGREGAIGQEDRVVDCIGTELLIVDKSSDTPIGLAGVKGGRFAGVHAGTKNIIIEAAHFHPTITRKTARRLGIVIDASKRFENEPSRKLPLYAQRDIVKLITDIAGGTFEGMIDEYLKKQIDTEVVVTVQKTNALLGLALTADEIKSIITRTGSTIVTDKDDGDSFSVVGPWERTDLTIEEDFIEEVGRIHGLASIESIVPEKAVVTEINQRHVYSEQIRRVLLELGFSEVITSSFHKKGKIQLQNALASDKSYVRSNLSKNLHSVLDTNFVNTDLLGVNDVRVFEIGTVFEKADDSVTEHLSLALGVRQKGSGYTPKDDVVVKDVFVTLTAALGTDLSFELEKGVAEVNLTTLLAVLPMSTTYEPFVAAEVKQFAPYSLYPAVSRDIAMWVTEGTASAEVETLLTEQAGPLRVRTTFLDEFTKDGKTSFAFRLVFQSKEKTLTDAEVNAVMEQVNAAVAAAGFEVR